MLRHLFLSIMLVSTTAAAAPVFPGGGTPAFPEADRVVRGADGRSVSWVEGRLGSLAVVDEASVVKLASQLGPHLGLDRPSEELVIESLHTDALGMHHARFFRVHEGRPVVESDLVFHFAADGALVTINGQYPATLDLPPLKLSVDAPLFERRAVDEARVVLRDRNEPETVAAKTKSRVVVWPNPARYVVEVEVEFEPHQKWRLFMDVMRGTKLAGRNLVQHDSLETGSGKDSHGQTRTLQLTYVTNKQVYAMLDQTNGSSGGALATLNANYSESTSGSVFSSATKTFTDKAAVDVHANMRIIYDYFKDTHGRTSWDGRGADMLSVVHYGRQYGNAFWNGELMAFGDGDGHVLLALNRCLDVAAHELSHAVITGTVDLVYENQSGALNEHFADVFGVIIDDANWNMGEDCAGPGLPKGYLRNLSDPVKGNQPAHMSQYYDLPNTEDGDWGGVHINSGIVNKAAHLVGSQLGRPTLGAIWYRILDKHYLNSRSQFQDMRRAALRACKDLYPSPADTCATVAAAFDSVGIVEADSGGSGCPANSSEQDGSCYCNDGYRVNAQGTGCERIANIDCPPNSEQVGDSCYCKDGYVVNAAGTGCERAGTSCPSNSHRSGGVCVCDDGYQGSPAQGHGCTAITSDCPPNSRPVEDDPDSCYCIDGWVVNAAKTACVPGNTGCGDETYYGRCNAGTLVYCENDTIRELKCSESGYVCGLQSAEVGNNCLKPKETPCGGLTFEGECVGNVSRWCQDNVVREKDCAEVQCVYIDSTYGYACNPCPANSVYNDGSCSCVSGFEPDAAGKTCVKTKTDEPKEPDEPAEPDESTDPDDSDAPKTRPEANGRNSGCSSGGGGAGGLALLLVFGWLFRRRPRMAAALLVATSVACSKSSPEVVPDEPIVEAVSPVRSVANADGFEVSEGSSWTSADGTLQLSVKAVVPSSLCPKGARCVWAGQPAHALIEATVGERTETLELFEDEPVNFDAWRIVALSVTPPSARLSAKRVVVSPE